MVVLGFPGGPMVQSLPANAGGVSLIPLRGGHGDPLQYSCLGDPMDRGTLWATQSTGL